MIQNCFEKIHDFTLNGDNKVSNVITSIALLAIALSSLAIGTYLGVNVTTKFWHGFVPGFALFLVSAIALKKQSMILETISYEISLKIEQKDWPKPKKPPKLHKFNSPKNNTKNYSYSTFSHFPEELLSTISSYLEKKDFLSFSSSEKYIYNSTFPLRNVISASRELVSCPSICEHLNELFPKDIPYIANPSYFNKQWFIYKYAQKDHDTDLVRTVSILSRNDSRISFQDKGSEFSIKAIDPTFGAVSISIWVASGEGKLRGWDYTGPKLKKPKYSQTFQFWISDSRPSDAPLEKKHFSKFQKLLRGETIEVSTNNHEHLKLTLAPLS